MRELTYISGIIPFVCAISVSLQKAFLNCVFKFVRVALAMFYIANSFFVSLVVKGLQERNNKKYISALSHVIQPVRTAWLPNVNPLTLTAWHENTYKWAHNTCVCVCETAISWTQPIHSASTFPALMVHQCENVMLIRPLTSKVSKKRMWAFIRLCFWYSPPHPQPLDNGIANAVVINQSKEFSGY